MGLYPEGLEDVDDEYFTGTATVTGVTRNAAFDGMVEVEFDALGNGVLANFAAFASASGIFPALVLNYAGAEGGRFRADGISKTFDDLHIFDRASTATNTDSAGLLEIVASGAHRLGHDKDGNRIGLLREKDAATNICLQSNGFDTTWAPTRADLTGTKTTR